MNPRPPLLACLVMLVLFAAPVVGQQTPEELFQSALYKQQVEGDLEGAKEILQTLIEDYAEHREVAASALVLLGRVHETLGSANAERAYQRVLNEYPDQRAAAEEARARLARLTQELAQLRHRSTFTKIEIASKPGNGVLSPDGEELAFVSDGGVWVVPLHGNVDPTIAGAPVRIADVEGVWDNCSQLAWSGDGRWIAVNGTVDTADAVYVVPLTGGEPRVIRMPKRGSHAYSYRLSLAPDGGTLAFSALGPDQVAGPNETQKRFIHTVAVPDGRPHRLTDMWGRLPAFSPDGETIAYVSHRQRDTGDWESDLWLVPAAGGQPVRVLGSDSGRIRGPVWSPDGKFIAAHHEPGLNNYSAQLWILEVASAGSGAPPTTIELPTASWNMLAGWTPDDRLGVFMTTPEGAGVAYTVPASGGKAVQITPEAGRASDLAWSPDGDRIYLKWRGDDRDSSWTYSSDAVLGFIPAGGGRVAELPAAWGDEVGPGFGLAVSPDGGKIAFMGIGGIEGTTGRRPQPDQIGIWTVGVRGGEPERLTSGPTYDALPSWSPDGRWIAFLRMADGYRWNVYVVAAEGGDVRPVTSDADSVAAGKVAFSPDGRRIAFFSRGAIKSIPLEGGHAEALVAVGSLDPFPELAWSPDGQRIAHTSDARIWVDLLPDGARRELSTGLSQDLRYSSVAWSPDGGSIAFVAWRPSEIGFWLIDDFLPSRR